MSAWTSVYLGSANVNPSTTGAEITSARRQLDLSDVQYARFSYAGGGLLGDCSLGVSYSTDYGATWRVLVPAGASLGLSNYVYGNPWLDLTATYGQLGDVWVTVNAYGAALLGGLLYSVIFMELQLR